MPIKISFKVLAFIGIIFLLLAFLIKPYYNLVEEITETSPLKILLLEGNYKKTGDRINIVFLGKAGAQHDGPNLTDSILVGSYDIKNKKMISISVPRDIWSNTIKDKINSAYAYGEAKKKGGGMVLAKSEVGAIVGIPIHYAVVIDFEKFKELIDYLGGLDINVERSFDDYKFPVPGKETDDCNGDLEYKCRYRHISFKKGIIHMNGEEALIFVRSRNAQGEEGTDFARNDRQQKILQALSEKIVNRVKKLDVNEIRQMYQIIDKIVERDMQNSEAAYIAKRVLLARNISVKQISLVEDLFEIPRRVDYEGKFVLIPKEGSFTTIHEYIECVLNTNILEKCKMKLQNEGKKDQT